MLLIDFAATQNNREKRKLIKNQCKLALKQTTFYLKKAKDIKTTIEKGGSLSVARKQNYELKMCRTQFSKFETERLI